MNILVWIISGIVAGWIAGLLVRGRGFGLSGDLIIGLLGGLIGGWLADTVGFQATFMVSVVCGLLMAAVLYFALQDPALAQTAIPQPVIQTPME